MIKAIFFDLDGTLLPMNEKEFIELYFSLLYKKIENLGYSKENLTNIVWSGTKLMYKNDGSKTNEQVFWDYFASINGKEKLSDKKVFDEFYTNEFYKTRSVCKENPLAKDIIKYCKEKIGKVILSTNPIFPLDGTKARMSFINLKEEDFDYVTSYENSSFCKPNPLYFKTLLDKFNLKPNEVILFGNSILEDGECASSLGIKVYMVGDYVIPYPEAKKQYEHIKMEDIIPIIEKELSE